MTEPDHASKLCSVGNTRLLLGVRGPGRRLLYPRKSRSQDPRTFRPKRALLTWKDGVETLLLSSSLNSESQKLGWLIPLPAVPRSIEKASPGSLKTLTFCVQPEIIHDLHGQAFAIVFLIFAGNLLVGTFLFWRRHLAAMLLLVFFVFVIIPAGLLPAGGSASAVASAVRVEKSVKAGAYAVQVLRPAKPNDLNAWLGENGFAALPATADVVTADYIAKGWVFAAIRLTRDESVPTRRTRSK